MAGLERDLDKLSRMVGRVHGLVVLMIERRKISRQGLKDAEGLLQDCIEQLKLVNQRVNR